MAPRASEDQSAVEGAQLVVALDNVVPEKHFMGRPAFGEYGFDVRAVAERSFALEKHASEAGQSNGVGPYAGVGNDLDVVSGGAERARHHNGDSHEECSEKF